MIINIQSSILHQLNATILYYRSALRPVIHYYKLQISSLVYNCNSCLHRVVVCCNVKAAVFGSEVPGWSVVEHAFLHL
jgi:hypothetical protein